jgi:hypothetical protein
MAQEQPVILAVDCQKAVTPPGCYGIPAEGDGTPADLSQG